MKSLEEIRENVMKATFPEADKIENSDMKEYLKYLAELSLQVAYNTFKELNK